MVVPALLVTAVWWFAAWTPATQARAAAIQRAERTGSEASQLTARVRTAEDFRTRGADADAELDRARTALPDVADVATFVRMNDALAARTGVRVESFNPTEADPKKRDLNTPKGTTATKLSLTVSGTSSSAIDYLRGLQGVARAVVVDHITMTTVGDAVRLDLGARIFSNAKTVGFGGGRGT